MQTLKGIVYKFIDELNQELKTKKITVNVNEEAVEFIANKGSLKDMGARPLKRYIQDNITNALSDEILFGKLKNGGEVKVTLDAESAELVLEFEELDDTSGK
jgi:ATP-dependent Clp protease ATP-binding subunit ClpA